jgi:hypothetical protein
MLFLPTGVARTKEISQHACSQPHLFDIGVQDNALVAIRWLAASLARCSGSEVRMQVAGRSLTGVISQEGGFTAGRCGHPESQLIHTSDSAHAQCGINLRMTGRHQHACPQSLQILA